MRKLNFLVIFFTAFLLLLNNIFAYGKTDVNFHSYNSFDELIKTQKMGRPLVIFSSRYYIIDLKRNDKLPEKIYWVLPVDEIKGEDFDMFKEQISRQFKIQEIKMTSEGIEVDFEKTRLYIMLYENIPMIDMDEGDVLIDVDYFFRSYKNDIKTPKVESVVNLFNAFKEYDWNVRNIFLVKSLDINLPDWVQEYAFITAKIYDFWIKKIFPKPFLALDFVDQALFYFAQYNEAYNVLKEIEEFHKDNPYFFHRLFLASLRNYKDDDVLYSIRKAYEIDRNMFNLYFEGADYLISKGELYPAYVLLSDGLSLEPWNKKIKEKLKEVVELGYNYYNAHEGNDELFEFFKRKKESVK